MLFYNKEEIGCGRKGYYYGTSFCVFTIITSYTKRCTSKRHFCWSKFEWNPTRSFWVICNLVSLSLIQRQALSLDFACLFIYSLAMGPELFACLSIYENAETCPLGIPNMLRVNSGGWFGLEARLCSCHVDHHSNHDADAWSIQMSYEEEPAPSAPVSDNDDHYDVASHSEQTSMAQKRHKTGITKCEDEYAVNQRRQALSAKTNTGKFLGLRAEKPTKPKTHQTQWKRFRVWCSGCHAGGFRCEITFEPQRETLVYIKQFFLLVKRKSHLVFCAKPWRTAKTPKTL